MFSTNATIRLRHWSRHPSLRQDREAMQDSDEGISIRGQVQVKPAGPCSEHVAASALSTLHISQIFYASPREFIFMVAVKAIFYSPVSANPFSCSLQGSTVNWLACWLPFLTQPLYLSKLGDYHKEDTQGAPPWGFITEALCSSHLHCPLPSIICEAMNTQGARKMWSEDVNLGSMEMSSEQATYQTMLDFTVTLEGTLFPLLCFHRGTFISDGPASNSEFCYRARLWLYLKPTNHSLLPL